VGGVEAHDEQETTNDPPVRWRLLQSFVAYVIMPNKV